ncbi:MAG: hypothetical protein J7K38_00725 [Thermoplasmata archaeon]|nr:hypothetical protein [Thermoplasmata archaeon]
MAFVVKQIRMEKSLVDEIEEIKDDLHVTTFSEAVRFILREKIQKIRDSKNDRSSR